MKRVLFKVIVSAVIIAVWMLICYPVCYRAEGFDWFLYWIIVGCPLGIRRMCLWLISKNFSISESIGILALNCIIGGLIGGSADFQDNRHCRRAYQYCNRTLLDKKSKSGNIELLDILSKGGAVRTWLLFYCQKEGADYEKLYIMQS